MNINESFLLVNYIVNKFRSGSISPLEWNIVTEAVNLDAFKFYTGMPEMYNLRQAPVMGWQSNQKVTDINRHLHIPYYIMRSADGYFKLPSNYAAFSSIMTPLFHNSKECDGTPETDWRLVEVVTEAERAIRLQNRVIPPIETKPIASFYAQGVMVDPTTINRIRLAYLRYPIAPVWNYTIVNGQPVYNAANSKDWDWPALIHADLCMRICKYVGINLREDELVRYMDERIKTGS